MENTFISIFKDGCSPQFEIDPQEVKPGDWENVYFGMGSLPVYGKVLCQWLCEIKLILIFPKKDPWDTDSGQQSFQNYA